jgi:hypothetical protein
MKVKAALVRRFCKKTSCSKPEANFYLERVAYDVDKAIRTFQREKVHSSSDLEQAGLKLSHSSVKSTTKPRKSDLLESIKKPGKSNVDTTTKRKKSKAEESLERISNWINESQNC